MKMQVDFYGLNDQKEDYKVGTLLFNGIHFIWKDTAYEGIKELSEEPILIDNELIDPNEEPIKFMKNLHMAYTGTYLRAGKVNNL